MLATALLCTCFLSGCLPDWDTYTARQALLTDADGDGFTPLDGDCSDADPARFPGADELCDGLDDDCDGEVDEDPLGEHTLWYLDSDADGWGVISEPIVSCGRPAEGYTERTGDCDDADRDVRPDTEERCDGADNDCDSLVDEQPAQGTPTWYQDEDEDGYGDDEATIITCDAPAGYVSEGGDCDTADPTTHPGANELCDGLDNDCDGAEDDPPVTGDGAWFPDLDHDGFGDEGSSEVRCSSAAGYTTTGGDCDDADVTVNPAEVEVCNDGADNDCDGGLNGCAWPAELDMTEYVKIAGAYPSGAFGWTGAMGDLTGDGADELILTDYGGYDQATGTWPGKVVGFETPLVTSVDWEEGDIIFTGAAGADAFGVDVSIKDLDHDGYDDLVVGAMQVFSTASSNPGKVYVMYGPNPTSDTVSASGNWVITGRENDDWFGMRIETVEDLSGDGQPDFVVAQEEDSYYDDYSGSVYLFRGVGSGTDSATTESFATLYGTASENYFGSDTAGLDFDGDGHNDLAVSAENGGVGGTVHLYTGPFSGSLSNDDSDLIWYSESVGSLVGEFVSAAEDVNGDGYADLLVSGSQSYSAGAAFLLWGGPSITTAPIYDAQVKFRKDSAGCCFGHLVEVVGDINDDGEEDILIGEKGGAPDSLYLFYGPFDSAMVLSEADADVLLTGDGTSDANYELAFNGGDLTGDGVTDLIVGSYQHDPGPPASDSGAAYLIAGLGL